MKQNDKCVFCNEAIDNIKQIICTCHTIEDLLMRLSQLIYNQSCPSS